MIGQKYLKKYVKHLQDEENFPHFAIFVGRKGCGKKTFLKEYFDGIYPENNKVDSIRKIIEMAYQVSDRTFIIPDADDMSNAAKNALLKVVEECPNNNYFIMTLEDEINTLETIRSRAQMFYFDMYFPKDLSDYATTLGVTEDLDAIGDVCDTPGEVNILIESGVRDFIDYVQLVYDNIMTVSLPNALKIGNKVAMKDGAEGFDLKLFWRIFERLCMKEGTSQSASKSIITSKALMQLRRKGINRQMLFDTWVFEVRGLF